MYSRNLSLPQLDSFLCARMFNLLLFCCLLNYFQKYFSFWNTLKVSNSLDLQSAITTVQKAAVILKSCYYIFTGSREAPCYSAGEHAWIQEFISGRVQARRPENILDNVVFLFFLVLNLFYSLQWGSYCFITEKTNYIFPRIQRGSNIFQGGGVGSNFFQGGSKCYLVNEQCFELLQSAITTFQEAGVILRACHYIFTGSREAPC